MNCIASLKLGFLQPMENEAHQHFYYINEKPNKQAQNFILKYSISATTNLCRSKRAHINSPSALTCTDRVGRVGGAYMRECGHCCLQVESLRILLAVDMPLREGLDEELERRSDLGFSAAGSVPFTQTGFTAARLLSVRHSSSSSSSSST